MKVLLIGVQYIKLKVTERVIKCKRNYSVLKNHQV